MNAPTPTNAGLSALRHVLVVFAVLFVAAAVLCGWLLATSHDAIFIVLGTAALVGTVGTGGAVRAARIGLRALSTGAAGVPQLVRARGLARAATTGLLFGALVPVLVAVAMVLTNRADVAVMLLSVMGALVLGMWSMVVDTCRKLLDRADPAR